MQHFVNRWIKNPYKIGSYSTFPPSYQLFYVNLNIKAPFGSKYYKKVRLKKGGFLGEIDVVRAKNIRF